MAGVKALRKIQGGKETTKGTAVAATFLWRGNGTLEDQRELTHVDEDIGYLSGVDRTYTGKYLAVLEMEEIEATFEQLPYILEGGVIAETPAQDGAGSGYIYEYPFPTTAANTIRTYTLEGGDDQQAREAEYAFVSDFTISGASGGSVMMGAKWSARQVANTTFTAAIAVPSVEEILFQKSKLYLDAASGTVGTTQITEAFLGFSLNVNTGIIPVFTGDGNLYFTFDKQAGPEITCEVTFEHDGTATAEITNFENETARLMRIEIEGSAFTTAGTDYTYKTLRLDLAGKWDSFSKIGEQDGNDIVTGTLRARYNSTAALFAEITVANDLSTLT